MDLYPATYSDAHGSETTTIANASETLRLSMRGVEFVGRDFDSLEPTGAPPKQLQRFRLSQGCLCSCRVECRIPVPVHERGKLSDGWLAVELMAVVTIRSGGNRRVRQTPSTARLLLSVAPLVKTLESGSARIANATCERAFSTARAAGRPSIRAVLVHAGRLQHRAASAGVRPPSRCRSR